MRKNEHILAVGSIALDNLETPCGNCNDVLGGSATYFSFSASRFFPVKIVGVVGTDFPKSNWDLFNSKNIDVNNIQIKPGKTFRWGGKYSSDYSKRDTLFTDLGVFQFFDPQIKKKDCNPGWVFLGNTYTF